MHFSWLMTFSSHHNLSLPLSFPQVAGLTLTYPLPHSDAPPLALSRRVHAVSQALFVSPSRPLSPLYGAGASSREADKEEGHHYHLHHHHHQQGQRELTGSYSGEPKTEATWRSERFFEQSNDVLIQMRHHQQVFR